MFGSLSVLIRCYLQSSLAVEGFHNRLPETLPEPSVPDRTRPIRGCSIIRLVDLRILPGGEPWRASRESFRGTTRGTLQGTSQATPARIHPGERPGGHQGGFSRVVPWSFPWGMTPGVSPGHWGVARGIPGGAPWAFPRWFPPPLAPRLGTSRGNPLRAISLGDNVQFLNF